MAKRTYAAAVACSRASKSSPAPSTGSPQLGAEPREPGFGERVEQRLAIGEVPPRRAVADADLARELTQRELVDAVLADGALGLREQGRAQVAVVIGTLTHAGS